jgi:hypothetical protein
VHTFTTSGTFTVNSISAGGPSFVPGSNDVIWFN